MKMSSNALICEADRSKISREQLETGRGKGNGFHGTVQESTEVPVNQPTDCPEGIQATVTLFLSVVYVTGQFH